MANTPQGSRAPMLLHAVVLLAAAAAVQAQQDIVGFQGYLDYVTGQCSNYQTSSDFTQSYIDQLTASQPGYILVLSTGNTDSCQKLSFLSDNEFKFSFIDIANFPRTYTSSYEISLANLTRPAQIKLNMLPGLLGADVGGALSLKPLIVDADKLVMAACWQRGYFKREQLQVFVPFPSTASVDAIKADLIEKQILGAENLQEISQDCVAGERKAPQPIPLRLYNLVLALDNSDRQQPRFRSGAVTNPALDFYKNFQQPTVSNFALPFSPFYQPAAAVYQPAGAVYQPAGTVYQPAGAVYQPAGAVYQPAGSVYQPAGSVYQPAGSVYQPAAAVYQPAGSVYQPAGAVYQPAVPITYSVTYS